MKNGDINDFMDHLYYGGELVFEYLKANHWKRDATEVKPLKALARQLSTTDLARYWLFCYEALTEGSLPNEWKALKKANISFIRPEFLEQPDSATSQDITT